MNLFVEAFLNTLPAGLAIVLAVYLVLRWTPRLNAATRYSAWWVTLIAILALPVFFLPTSHRLEQAPDALWANEAAPIAEAESMIRVDGGETVPVFGILWAAIAFILSLRLLLGYIWLRRVKTNAEPLGVEAPNFRRRISLLVSSEIESPIAVGFLRPAAVIPRKLASRLSPAELDEVLIHEYAHLARRDDWMNLLGRILEALLWFHPLAWFILRRLKLERELACDDWVVHRTGDARAYAATLLRITELRLSGREPSLATGFLGRKANLSYRIETLLRFGRRFVPAVSRPLLALTTVFVAALSFGALQLPAFIEVHYGERDLSESQPPIQSDRQDRQDRQDQPGPLAPPPKRPPTSRVRPPQAPKIASAPTEPAPVPVPFRQHGTGFLASLKAAGYTNLNVEEIIELKNNGVSGGYLAEMSSLLGNISAKEMIRLQTHGVRPSDIRKAKEFKSDLSIDQIVRLKTAGVID